jgi:hypothetical protein
MLHPKGGAPFNNKAAETRVQSAIEKRAQVVDAINQTTWTEQVIPLQYKPGEQVWLEATHLKIRHQKTKLNPK